jgi:ribosome-binding protein aMBF1 (putative translation factor)
VSTRKIDIKTKRADPYERKGKPNKGDNPFLVRLGARVRELRETLEIDQGTLAERCDHSQPWVSYLERGHSDISVTELPKLAKALRTTVVELLTW